jgi:nucleotide-binding universal stress UspA family protein
MKNILLLIHDDPGEEARLQAALDLVRAVSGHLICLDIVQIPVLIGTDFVMANASAMLLADAREREEENRSRVEARLAVEDISWSWIDASGSIARSIEARATLADIIVLNTSYGLPEMRGIVSDVVMRSGKLVLAVPEDMRGLNLAGHALLAWNGSPVAARIVSAATPLLALAEAVTLVEIGTIAAEPAEEAATYLSRYGIDARIERHSLIRGSTADILLDLCKERGPAYCVMGAYGHSRLREGLFGGVTRRMLADSPVPLLLGH